MPDLTNDQNRPDLTNFRAQGKCGDGRSALAVRALPCMQMPDGAWWAYFCPFPTDLMILESGERTKFGARVCKVESKGRMLESRRAET